MQRYKIFLIKCLVHKRDDSFCVHVVLDNLNTYICVEQVLFHHSISFLQFFHDIRGFSDYRHPR